MSAGSLLTPETFRGPACKNAKVQEMRLAYTSAVDKVMCTKVCPCDYGPGN